MTTRPLAILALAAVLVGCPGKATAPASGAFAPAPAADRLLEIRARIARGPGSLLEEHELWLEAAEELEARRARAPGDLPVVRELLVSYLHLLPFERASDLALGAARALRDLEAGPALAPEDARLARDARAWLFFSAKLYPCALAALPERDHPIRRALDALGEGAFVPLEPFRVGPLAVTPERATMAAPDPGVLHSVIHFVAAKDGSTDPARTVSYALLERGSPGRERSYLYGLSLDGASLVRVFGTKRPDYSTLRAIVASSIERGLGERSR